MNSAVPAESTAARPDSLRVRLLLVAVGLVLLAVSQLARWLRPGQEDLMSLWACAGLALASLPVLRDSVTSLKTDGFEATKYYMDQFVALAILACFAIGQYAAGTLVAAILIVGQMLEERTAPGGDEALRTLGRLTRVRARRLPAGPGDTEEIVDASTLRPGDLVCVRPGETVPADGEIAAGTTALDQAAITGESLPVDAAPGSKVYAGTVNLNGTFEFRVDAAGNATVLGRVAGIVEEARSSRAPLMRLIDDYTRYYLPFVLITAGFVLFFTGEPERAIAVVIVAMPCAFVLASPSAMVAALAVAARLGIVVKSPRSFEVAAAAGTVVFDKTGTLTTGRLQVTAVRAARHSEPDRVLALAAGLASVSSHPAAAAVAAAARARGLAAAHAENAEEFPGLGLRAGNLRIGRRRWLAEAGAVPPPELGEEPEGSCLWVACGDSVIGVISLADRLRPEAPAAVAELRALGCDEIVLLTGDRPAVAAAVAAATDIAHVRAECLPADKLAEVRRLQAAGRRVIVVGDGVNDAPALAAGDLGVALGALGSPVAVQTADIALMGHDLRALPRFLALSDRTLAIVNQNLMWGLVLIGVFVVLSATGWVSPIAAAVLHEASAFFVILNSARLLRFDETAGSGSPATAA